MAQTTAAPATTPTWHTEQPEHTRAFLEASRQRMEQNLDSPRRANFLHAFFDLHPEEPYARRYALSMAYALDNEPVYILADELLCGMTYQIRDGHATFRVEAESDWHPYAPGNQATLRVEKEFADPAHRFPGAPGHVGWRWDRILSHGVDALLTKLRAQLDSAHDDKARELYEGAVILWESVLRWNDRHVTALEQAATEATGADRERLESLAALCRRVPRQPARTFHEALQSFHMQHLAVMYENPYGGNGPGCMDRFLWPFLKHDLESGVLTMQHARDLIDELFIRFEERLYPGDGWVEAVTIGGKAGDGVDSPNPLTYLMIESIRDLEIVHPSVYVRLSPDSPDDLIALTVDYLLNGTNRAQVYNDNACLPSIGSGGVDAVDAVDYMAGGCMEISPQGMHSDFNFTAVHNVAKLFEHFLIGDKAEWGSGGGKPPRDESPGDEESRLPRRSQELAPRSDESAEVSRHCEPQTADDDEILRTEVRANQGSLKEAPPRHCEERVPERRGNLTAHDSFEALYTAFEAELARFYPEMARSLDVAREEYARLRPCYLLSSLVDDCLERGREQLDGGARYNDYGFSLLGVTSVADALTAIKISVFDDAFVTAPELLDALRTNFEGREDLRARLAALPKYGREHPDANAMCNRVLASVCMAARAPRNALGGALKPMMFNFVWTPEASDALQARADGARHGDLIGHGLTPQRTGMTKGLSAAVNSACSLDWSPVNGGATSMWDLDPTWITPDHLNAILRVFLNHGGMIFQGNMTSVADLEDALQHPENHPHLTVRVGGFSARFTSLRPELQQEIVGRYRHTA